MSQFRVAIDSSCLIGLVHINLFETLKEIFAEIYVPFAVYDEVAIKGKGRIGSNDVALAVKYGWLKQTNVQDVMVVKALTTTLSQGEAEVIILVKELGLDYALIDEKMGRNIAALMNVETIGVLGVLNIAASAGFLIDKKWAVDRLRQVGFRISDHLYNMILSA